MESVSGSEQESGPKFPEVTSENLGELRVEAARLREVPGKDDEALSFIRYLREGAMRFNEDEHVVNLFWEEFLVGKHILMGAREREGGFRGFPARSKDTLRGFHLMRNSANAAQRYIEDHSIKGALEARSHRFLGQVALVEGGVRRGGYQDAARHFREGAELFEQIPEWEDRVQGLELEGLLAQAEILSGKVDQGITTAQNLFREFEGEDGKRLRENDYYTWAVWRSGCAIKLWQALIEAKVDLNEEQRDDLGMMLDISESILAMSEESETWGDKDFTLRKREISQIRQQAGLEFR